MRKRGRRKEIYKRGECIRIWAERRRKCVYGEDKREEWEGERRREKVLGEVRFGVRVTTEIRVKVKKRDEPNEKIWRNSGKAVKKKNMVDEEKRVKEKLTRVKKLSNVSRILQRIREGREKELENEDRKRIQWNL